MEQRKRNIFIWEGKSGWLKLWDKEFKLTNKAQKSSGDYKPFESSVEKETKKYQRRRRLGRMLIEKQRKG